MTLAEKIKQLRIELNLSQKKLATLIGFHAQNIYYLENGTRKRISVDQAVKLSKIARERGINITAEYFSS